MQKFSLALAAATLVLLSACSPKTESTSAETASAPEAVVVTPSAEVAPPVVEAVAENDLGKGVYNKTCAMCHSAGAGGAPKPGDKADWAPRIAQGMDVLFKHASEGFTGTKGMMPAHGGNPALTNDEIKAAVTYMVDKSK